MLRTRAGRVRAGQATPPRRRQKTAKKQTSQPHGERQQKRAKIRRVCDRTKRRRRPKTSPPSLPAERLKLPRIMIYYAACFAFSAGAPLASPPSLLAERLHQLARHGQRYGRGATFLIGFFGLFRHKPSCSSPLSLVPRMVYEGAMIERTFYSYCSSKDLRGRSERKGFTLILFLERICIGRWCVVCGCRLEAMQSLL